MVKLNPTTRPRRTIDEVMQEVSERTPHLLQSMFLDRDWVWLCGVDLRGEHNAATREALKEIGFRFSPGGHTMPDGVTVGHWGHSANKPAFPKRKGNAATTHHRRSEQVAAGGAGDIFKDLGL